MAALYSRRLSARTFASTAPTLVMAACLVSLSPACLIRRLIGVEASSPPWLRTQVNSSRGRVRWASAGSGERGEPREQRAEEESDGAGEESDARVRVELLHGKWRKWHKAAEGSRRQEAATRRQVERDVRRGWSEGLKASACVYVGSPLGDLIACGREP